MTILSCKTIFGLTFSANLEKLLESFFRKVSKTVISAIFWHVWPKSAKMRIFIKIRSLLFFTLIAPQLHAEFQKNRWSGFRDQFVTDAWTDARTHKGDITEPVAFAGSIIVPLIFTNFWTL